MVLRFTTILICALLGFPAQALAEVVVFELNSGSVELRYDQALQTSVIHLRAADLARRLDAVERVDSAYLFAEITLANRTAAPMDLGCVKITTLGPSGELRFDSSFSEFNLEYNKTREVVLDITELVQYWRRDPSLVREFAVTRCVDSSDVTTFSQINFASVRIELRHSKQ